MIFFFFSSRRRHTRLQGDWSSDVCSSDLYVNQLGGRSFHLGVGHRSIRRAEVNRLRLDLLDADRKSTRLNSSHLVISYAVFCLKKKTARHTSTTTVARTHSEYHHPIGT